MAWTVINPATGETTRSYEDGSWEETRLALEAAHAAHEAWRDTSFAHRADRMRRAASILRARVEAHAELMAAEMGKPIREGRSVPADTPDVPATTYWAHEPLGVVLAVMPWNFPFWQVFRFAAPNLMAGNAGLLKHASNVPGCALAIEDVFREAGFPGGLFRSLLIDHELTERLIEQPLLRAVTLTGSVRAGKAVAAKAGSLVKKTVLERRNLRDQPPDQLRPELHRGEALRGRGGRA
jgi:succinate-semialdehyde dehydrogenase/glutarate-semialdehyde dehydrogenase